MHRSTKKIRILVGENPANARPAIMAAILAAFPAAEIIDAPSATDVASNALRHGAVQLIVGLLSPELQSVAAVTADGELPPWAQFVPTEDTAGLREALRCRLLLHQSQYENQRLRGDLKTIARRISHDLRSPVGSIHISADVLMELPPDDRTTIISMAEVVKQSSAEISQLVDRVSALLLATAQPAAAGRIDMGDIVLHVLHRLDSERDKLGAAVSVPATWPETSGVAAWAETIWGELLTNALRHGGTSPQIVVGWSDVPDGFRFTVTDSGPGMTPARQAVVFTPFERLHAVRAHGLGLAIVQRLVALQGGHCGYERPAAGSARFYFTLPAFP